MNIVYNYLNEAAPGFDVIGMPKNLSAKLMSKFRLKHDKELMKIDVAPRKKVIEAALIRQNNKNEWFVLVNVDKNAFFHVFTFKNGQLEEKTFNDYNKAKTIMGTGKSNWWMMDVYIEELHHQKI